MDDYLFALKLQEEFDKENSGNFKEPEKPVQKKLKGSLIDPEWEIIDPNPNIFDLFQQFNAKFFWNALGAVEVKWSPRMYSCAGICTYKGKAGCVVSLSLPLLKLRPRKDLIETLLHEMIHAYLFLTKNFRDRSDHGPEFHKHMNRINDDAGTKISVYHTFHDEVKFYKTHWWRCDGPCQNRPPYFGIVKRSMNRAPGPNDFWYEDHKNKCGGTFIKIKEPEGFKSRKRKNPGKETATTNKGKDITHFFPSPSAPKAQNDGRSIMNGKSSKKTSDVDEMPSRILGEGQNNIGPKVKPSGVNVIGFKDLTSPNSMHATGQNNFGERKANAAKTKSSGVNNVLGFGDLSRQNTTEGRGGTYRPRGRGGTGLMSNKGGTLVMRPGVVSETSNASSSEYASTDTESSVSSPFSGKGYVLGSGQTNTFPKSRLLNLYMPSTSNGGIEDSKERSRQKVKSIQNNTNVEDCDNSDCVLLDDSTEESIEKHVNCPVCNKYIDAENINEHLDGCAKLDDLMNTAIIIGDDDDDEHDSEQMAGPFRCPCCQTSCKDLKDMNEHLGFCLQCEDD